MTKNKTMNQTIMNQQQTNHELDAVFVKLKEAERRYFGLIEGRKFFKINRLKKHRKEFRKRREEVRRLQSALRSTLHD